MTGQAHHPVQGVLWMAAAAFCFSAALALVRHLSGGYSVFELVLIRQVVGVVLMLPWLARAGIGTLKTQQIGLHALRAAVSYAAMFGAYFAVTMISVSDATALGFTLPIFTMLCAMPLLGETIRPHRWIAMAVGFAGAMTIIRPGFVAFNPGMLIAVASAALFGFADTSSRLLARRDSVNAIVFYTFLLQLPIAAVGGALTWVMPTLADWPVIVTFCVFAFGANFCLTRSYAAAEASLVSPVLYLRLPFIAAIALVSFGEFPDLWTWIGTAILFASTIYSTRRDALAACREAAA